MMDQHQSALVSLLLGSFPNFQSGDAEAALAAYEIVLCQADERDLQPGVMMLINGEVAGHDGRFAPTAPQLAKAIRQAMHKRIDAENAVRAALPAPADEWVDDPPEVKALNKARLDALRADLAQKMDMDFAPLRDLQARTNAYFDPRPGYSVGDPDADGDMGGERVA